MAFQKIKISDWQFEINEDFPAQFLAGSMNGFIDGQRSSFIKLQSSKFTNVFKFNLLFKGKVYYLILKQFLNRSSLEIFKNLLFSCRADRAFKADLMLKQQGFAVPDAVAVGKKTVIGVPVRNFLITSEIVDSLSLYDMFDKDISQRQEIMSQFGLLVGRLHNENIFIGDLRFGNILVKTENGRFIFYLLDNERTKKFQKLPFRLRVKNLVQVYISRPDSSDAERDCFLNAYLSQQAVKFDKNMLTARIAARVQKRLAKKSLK